MKKKKILHRDLKCSNLLLNFRGDAKLSDFGSAKFLGTLASAKSLNVNGTPTGMAPEVYRRKPTWKSDIYSFGTMIYQMSLNQIPWDGYEPEQIYHTKVHEKQSIPEIPGTMDRRISNLIQKCCAFKENNRPTLDGVTKLLQEIELSMDEKQKKKKKMEFYIVFTM